MLFEEAKLYSSILHYIIFITLFISVCLYKNKGLVSFITRFYISLGIWALICFLIDGCPITLLENEFSLHYYGRPFYENYNFGRTDIKYLLTWHILYIPLIVVLIIKAVNYLTKDVI